MQLTFRPAREPDFEYCAQIYFREMAWVFRELEIDAIAHQSRFRAQWIAGQVQIIQAEGQQIGWLQTDERESEIFLSQIFIEGPFQRHGVGSEVLRRLLHEAGNRGKPVALDVVKSNPALRLYERFGFRITGEEGHKYSMRCDTHARSPGVS